MTADRGCTDEAGLPTATRRHLLGAIGVTVLAGCTGSGDNTSETPTPTSTEEPTTAEATLTERATRDGLASPTRPGGKVPAWVGQSPASVQGVENPPLRLVDGRRYELVWENLDGIDQEMKIADRSGDDIEKSESAETRGETVSMTVTARPQMVEYFCDYHPLSMRSDIVVDE